MANKIAVITMVKNEEDIIESFARHACKIADVLLVADHMSTDKTRSILESLQLEGFPIKIYDWLESKMDHGFVLTTFLHRAIDEESADLVIPLDADEFLIKPDGDSESLRRDLRQLDPEKCYYMTWVNFQLIEPEKDPEKFLLSREVVRESQPIGVPKTCVGAVAAKKFGLKIIKGGHSALYQNDSNFPQELIESGIFNAHFARRSSGQILSKCMGGWLTNLLKFGKYTRLSYDWKEDIDAFLIENILPEYHLANPTTATELENYRNECQNRYTIGNVDPLKNIYRIAETVFIEQFKLKILERRELVRIYVLFDGNVEDCLKSLDSAINQTYPYRKIFVTATTEKNLDELLKIASSMKFSEEIELISADDPSIISGGNGFVQFITSGDILKQEKIFDSIEAFYSDSFDRDCVICLGENQKQSFAPINYSSSEKFLCSPSRSEITLSILLANDAYFSAGLSGFLFRAAVLKNAVDLIPWLGTSNVDAFQLFFFEKAVEDCLSFFFLKCQLVEKNRVWTERDRIMFEKVRAMFAMKIRGEKFFSEDDYQYVKKDLFEKFAIELTE